MLGDDGNHHHRVFGPLGLVDGNRVRQDDFVEFGKVVGDGPLFEHHRQFLKIVIDSPDPAHVPVVDLFVIVVSNLHHLVVRLEDASAPDQMFLCGIEPFLEKFVQV